MDFDIDVGELRKLFSECRVYPVSDSREDDGVIHLWFSDGSFNMRSLCNNFNVGDWGFDMLSCNIDYFCVECLIEFCRKFSDGRSCLF